MKLVALISGGKDSCYNMLHCFAAGHKIVALAHLKPKDEIEELDSHMYQSVGHNAVEYFAKAMDLPLYQEEIGGGHLCSEKDYTETSGDEVEDLFTLLQKVKEKENIEGVASGAVLSDYQRIRVENVCSRLGLTSYAYLWRRNQTELLSEMVASGIDAVLVKVATLGLMPDLHLGKNISELFPHFLKLEKQYGMNVCGEGGEYETFTLDCSMFKEKIVIDEQVVLNHTLDAFAPVAYLKFEKLHLDPKSRQALLHQQDIVEDHSICRPAYFLYGLGIDYEAPFSPSTNLDIPKLEAIFQEKCSYNIAVSEFGWFWVTGYSAEPVADPADEMKISLQAVQNALVTHGLDMSSLVSVLLLVKDMQQFATLNSVYKTFFNMNPPSRACVQVPLPANVNFVMHCMGFKCSDQHCADDDDDDNDKTVIKHMHVQTVSHWAPANIGPYSQAVQVGNFIFVSGQIGLIPSTMVMIGGGIVPESRLSLRHVKRVLEAMEAKCSLENVLFCICYVTHHKLIAIAKKEWDNAANQNVEHDLKLNCVVVPALPRGACVEWQVVAHCEHPQGWNWTNSDVPSIDNISIKCNHGQFKSEKVLIARCFYVEGTCGLQENTISKILSYLIDAMSALADSEAAYQFQIFYSTKGTNWDTLSNAWKNLNLSEAGLSLIPVLSHETDDCILSIFGRVG